MSPGSPAGRAAAAAAGHEGPTHLVVNLHKGHAQEKLAVGALQGDAGGKSEAQGQGRNARRLKRLFCTDVGTCLLNVGENVANGAGNDAGLAFVAEHGVRLAGRGLAVDEDCA